MTTGSPLFSIFCPKIFSQGAVLLGEDIFAEVPREKVSLFLLPREKLSIFVLSFLSAYDLYKVDGYDLKGDRLGDRYKNQSFSSRLTGDGCDGFMIPMRGVKGVCLLVYKVFYTEKYIKFTERERGVINTCLNLSLPSPVKSALRFICHQPVTQPVTTCHPSILIALFKEVVL